MVVDFGNNFNELILLSDILNSLLFIISLLFGGLLFFLGISDVGSMVVE